MTVRTTLKVAGVTILSIVVGAYIWYKIRLYSIYNNISTVDQALLGIQKPNIVIIETSNQDIEDVATQGGMDGGDFQYSNGADNLQAAVRIDGAVYIGSSLTGLYDDGNGNIYDWNKDQLMYDGAPTQIDPLSIEYGIVDANGDFVNV